MKNLSIFAVLVLFCVSFMAQGSTREDLLAELNNRNNSAQVKDAVLKALIPYLSSQNVKDQIISVLGNRYEAAALRTTAAKVLSRIGNQEDVMRAISRAHDYSNNPDFRAVMIQSLYKGSSNPKIKNVLINNINRNHSNIIKSASIFALMTQINDSIVQNTLRTVFNSKRWPVELRIEALKSLLGISSSRSLSIEMMEALEDRRENPRLRAAVAKFLKFSSARNETDSVLLELIKYERNPELKVAAINSISPSIKEDDLRWMRPHQDPRTGSERDPFNL